MTVTAASHFQSKSAQRLARVLPLLMSIIFSFATNALLAKDSETPDHIGNISAKELLDRYPEFAEEYDSFEPSTEQLSAIQVLEGKDVMTLFGTWCHDSEREVPRLLKTLHQSGVQIRQLTLYAVSREKDDPGGYAQKYDLKYTPTFVISDSQGEIARVIEKPNGSLAGDFAKQIREKNSH